MEPLYVIGAAGVAIGGYLAIDSYSRRNAAGRDSVSVASRIAGAVRTGDVPKVRTGMPLLVGDRLQDGAPDNRNLNGLSRIAQEIYSCGTNGGNVVATLASIETQGGKSLSSYCFNCAAFNIHWTAGSGRPSFAHDNSLVNDFTQGFGSQVDGYKAAVLFLKAFFDRRSPQCNAAIMAGDLDAFQIALSRIDYSPGYTNSVQGNTIKPGRAMFRDRYARIVRAGFLRAP